MAPVLTRVKKEQLRKRCNNLLRRHNEFWLLYGMKSWLVMERPDGQIFKYYSHPGTSPPSEDDMVRAIHAISRCYSIWLQNANL